MAFNPVLFQEIAVRSNSSDLTKFVVSMQILGNNECFEPYTSNIYVRRVLSGEFTVVNQHLLMDLTKLGLWNPDLKNELVAANGSVEVSCFFIDVCFILLIV